MVMPKGVLLSVEDCIWIELWNVAVSSRGVIAMPEHREVMSERECNWVWLQDVVSSLGKNVR